MLKVMIADDEERICQLIKALIDWEALDMEVAGIAHNGLEASELVRRIRPDILITDIRMPGRSGLELIEGIKKDIPELEIIIISGYAHFEYAKSAIRYGVGDYLLKPINKTELGATLEKLKDRIRTRRDSEESQLQLRLKSDNDARRLQGVLLQRLMEQKAERLSYKILEEEYYLYMKPGCFQAFCLKIDSGGEPLNAAGRDAVIEKAKGLLESCLRPRCYEMLVGEHDWSCIGILNYDRKKQEELRRALRDCLNQLESEKRLYGDVVFSMSVGSSMSEPEDMGDSLREAAVIIEERFMKGTGRLLDYMPPPSALHEQNLLEKYLRQITHALEVMSGEEAEEALKQIKEAAMQVKGVRGAEILELVGSCGNLFLSQLEEADRAEESRRFMESLKQCSSQEELFERLSRLQHQRIEAICRQRENDAVRPIRQAKQYIQNHYSEPITQEEVSGIVGLSPAYFSVLFKKVEGEGFARYLISVRIEQAKILLRESNLSVSEICRKVGYNDLKHFIHTFEKNAGIKPATYRKLYG